MTAENLGMIFAPSLMRSPHLSVPSSPGVGVGVAVSSKVPPCAPPIAGLLSNPMVTMPFERAAIEMLIVYQREMFDV